MGSISNTGKKAHFDQRLKELLNKCSKRSDIKKARSMGRERTFEAYDLCRDGVCDTFIFQSECLQVLDPHTSVLIIPKNALRNDVKGYILTVTTGNHSVAALPLLMGKLWDDLVDSTSIDKNDVMTHFVLCANIVDGRLEISQREVFFDILRDIDDWLITKLGFKPHDVVMVDRTEEAVKYFRLRGEEWRVKAPAWKKEDMVLALASTRKRIDSSLRYYHGSRGVHFLTYPEFCRYVEESKNNYNLLTSCLRELTTVYEGHTQTFLREVKLKEHHEVELFGTKRGEALKVIVPKLEVLMQDIELKNNGMDLNKALAELEKIKKLFYSLLLSNEYADETSDKFIDSLYMNVSGEIYIRSNDEDLVTTFDDHRIALPGALFIDVPTDTPNTSKTKMVYDDWTDQRTRLLLNNLTILVSRGEKIEYANVYELPEIETEEEDKKIEVSEKKIELGQGSTREVIYKTNRSPIPFSLIDKRMAYPDTGYANYVLVRANVLKALGISLPYYRLLRKVFNKDNVVEEDYRNYYIRTRCEGAPLKGIPKKLLLVVGNMGEDTGEDPQVLSALISLMGDAAAQNLVMKKHCKDKEEKSSPIFDVGKEIYQFGYNLQAERDLPVSVSCCSLRGAFGWPDLRENDENLENIQNFYMGNYAQAILRFAKNHQILPLDECLQNFIKGFKFRIQAVARKYALQRDCFQEFKPGLHKRFHFTQRWHFVLWALDRHDQRIDSLVKALEGFVHNPDSIPEITPQKYFESTENEIVHKDDEVHLMVDNQSPSIDYFD